MDWEYYNRRNEEGEFSMRACVWSLIGIIVVLLLSFLFTGCATRVVTVPEIHTEYVVRTDSFVKKDTVRTEKETIVREMTPEDSLMLAKYGIRLKENERMILFLQKELEREKSIQAVAVHDTILKTDSIPYKVEVEKPLTWWQRQKIEFGELAMLIMAGLLVFVLIKRKFS